MNFFLFKRSLILTSLPEVIFLYHEKEKTAQISKKAYKKRESPNQKGDFRF